MSSITIEYSDGTVATIVVDDDTAESIAESIESLTGIRMHALMSSISYEERFTHPTTADVEAVLNIGHCLFCAYVGRESNRSWRTAPNTQQGRAQLDRIGRHFIDHNIGKDKFDA